jgi:transcriptional regulator with XRE-family HTH domain
VTPVKKHRFSKLALGARRELEGLTQKALADEIGVDRSAISHWESPKSTKEPSAPNFKALCRALNCRAADLLVRPE